MKVTLFPLQMKQNFHLILIDHSNYMAFEQDLCLATSQAQHLTCILTSEQLISMCLTIFQKEDAFLNLELMEGKNSILSNLQKTYNSETDT